MSDRETIKVMMRGLVKGAFGCLDAAAETINATWGGGASKGTISKRNAGHLSWSVEDVIALEDAAGRYPITKMMARRMKDTAHNAGTCLIASAGQITKETSEAVCAILAAEQSANADESAEAIKEIDEAIEALRQARATCEARQ